MITAPFFRLTLLVSLLALFVVASLPLYAAPMKWSLGGYVQARFNDQLGENAVVPDPKAPSTLLDTRPSLLVRATDEEHVFLQFFISSIPGTSPEFQHAFAEYQAKPYYVRLGLSPIPFGYENPISSCRLITMERSKISADLIGKKGLDRGLFGYYLPGKGLNASVGIVNGEDYTASADTNNVKNAVARVGYSIPGSEIGVSAIVGKDAADATFNRYGVDLLTKQGDFTILSEYITGKSGAVKESGAYLTAAYKPASWIIEPYARYDFANTKDADKDYSRITVGGGYYLNPTSKVSVEFQSTSDDANPDLDGNIAAQYQIIF